MPYVPIRYISAKTGQGVNSLLQMAQDIFRERSVRIKTKKLNDIIRSAVEQKSPPIKNNRKPKIKFAVQSSQFPPTFVLRVTHIDLIPISYAKYLENKIRDYHPFVGTPLRIVFRPNQKKKTFPDQQKEKETKKSLQPLKHLQTMKKLSPISKKFRTKPTKEELRARKVRSLKARKR